MNLTERSIRLAADAARKLLRSGVEKTGCATGSRRVCAYAAFTLRRRIFAPALTVVQNLTSAVGYARTRRAKRMRRPCRQCVHCVDKLTYRTVGWPTDRAVVSQISIGRWIGERLQQDRKHCQSAFCSARFSCFPFFFKKPNVATRGYKRRHT
jgi:hypothetical protein